MKTQVVFGEADPSSDIVDHRVGQLDPVENQIPAAKADMKPPLTTCELSQASASGAWGAHFRTVPNMSFCAIRGPTGREPLRAQRQRSASPKAHRTRRQNDGRHPAKMSVGTSRRAPPGDQAVTSYACSVPASGTPEPSIERAWGWSATLFGVSDLCVPHRHVGAPFLRPAPMINASSRSRRPGEVVLQEL